MTSPFGHLSSDTSKKEQTSKPPLTLIIIYEAAKGGFFVSKFEKERDTIFVLLKKQPPIERRPDGSLPIMTPKQRKQANTLIRQECCNCFDGNCILLDDGDPCVCAQSISYAVLCKWFRWFVLPGVPVLETEIFGKAASKCCVVCNAVFVPKSNRGKYCTDCAQTVHRIQKAASERKRRANVDN